MSIKEIIQTYLDNIAKSSDEADAARQLINLANFLIEHYPNQSIEFIVNKIKELQIDLSIFKNSDANLIHSLELFFANKLSDFSNTDKYSIDDVESDADFAKKYPDFSIYKKLRNATLILNELFQPEVSIENEKTTYVRNQRLIQQIKGLNENDLNFEMVSKLLEQAEKQYDIRSTQTANIRFNNQLYLALYVLREKLKVNSCEKVQNILMDKNEKTDEQFYQNCLDILKTPNQTIEAAFQQLNNLSKQEKLDWHSRIYLSKFEKEAARKNASDIIDNIKSEFQCHLKNAKNVFNSSFQDIVKTFETEIIKSKEENDNLMKIMKENTNDVEIQLKYLSVMEEITYILGTLEDGSVRKSILKTQKEQLEKSYQAHFNFNDANKTLAMENKTRLDLHRNLSKTYNRLFHYTEDVVEHLNTDLNNMLHSEKINPADLKIINNACNDLTRTQSANQNDLNTIACFEFSKLEKTYNNYKNKLQDVLQNTNAQLSNEIKNKKWWQALYRGAAIALGITGFGLVPVAIVAASGFFKKTSQEIKNLEEIKNKITESSKTKKLGR